MSDSNNDNAAPGATAMKGRRMGRKKPKEEEKEENAAGQLEASQETAGAKRATGPGLRKNSKIDREFTEENGDTPSVGDVGNAVEEAASSSIKVATGRGLRNTADRIRAKQQQAADASVASQPARSTTASTTQGFPRGLGQANQQREAKARASGGGNPTEDQDAPVDQEQEQGQDTNVVDPTGTGVGQPQPKSSQRGLRRTPEEWEAKAQEAQARRANRRGTENQQLVEEEKEPEGSPEINDIETPPSQSFLPETLNANILRLEPNTENHEHFDIETPSQPDKPLSHTGVSNCDLVQAKLVTEESQLDLLQAEEIDPAELERKTTEKKKNKECLAIGFCISVTAIGVAVLLGVLFSASKNAMETAPTSIPSLAPSTAPSESPSFAPSTTLAVMVDGLPEATLASLENVASPQRKAMDWLEDHPNVTFMEEWRMTQLFAMATFYYAMDGDNWPTDFKRSWLNDIDECQWQSNEFGLRDPFYGSFIQLDLSTVMGAGVTYNMTPCNEQGRFQNLFLVLGLQSSEVTPSIPPQLALLTSLANLALPRNKISAPPLAEFLPPELYLMENLTAIDLSSSFQLESPLPSELRLMTSLVKLNLAGNSLTGALPSEMGLMTSLTWLSLYFNSFSGTLPSELGLMSSMTELDLAYNSFSGALPSEMGLMSNMTQLSLFENNFSGALPSELGLVTGLTDLSLYRNSFSGSLPSELGLMSSMTALYLRNNSFVGALPSEMGLMSSLTKLDLGYHSFSGALPSELGQMSSLTELNLRNNSFAGALPSEMGLMSSLTVLDLEGHSFSGTIPMELQELATNGSLQRLDLRNTSLLGIVPESLCSIRDYQGEVSLYFDCSELLCGCCWCPCPGSNYTEKCAWNGRTPFNPSEDDEAWPGSFSSPANQSNVLTINVRTDNYPEETRVEWSVRNESGFWQVLQAQKTTNASSLHSYTQHVEWDTLYRLQLFDSDGDGICCSNGFGWLTVTNSTPSDEFAAGSVVWEARGDVFESSFEILIRIDSIGNAQSLPSLHYLFDPSKEDEEWPGVFPPSANHSNALTINIHTDDYPEDTSMEWSFRNESGLWHVIDSQSTFKAINVHSYIYGVESDSFYRLHLSEGYGKGTCCDYGLGWFTITNSTPSNDFEEGTLVWKARGDVLHSSVFLETDPATWEETSVDVFIWVDSNGHAQAIDYNPEEEQGLVHDKLIELNNSTIVVPLAVVENTTTSGEVSN